MCERIEIESRLVHGGKHLLQHFDADVFGRVCAQRDQRLENVGRAGLHALAVEVAVSVRVRVGGRVRRENIDKC